MNDLDDFIYYDYRDRDGQLQHGKVRKEVAGQMIGDLVSRLELTTQAARLLFKALDED